MDRIVCIAGPTASGKTDLAVALAKALNGEVVSCDSMQVYRRMDIGTAKPSQEEMGGVPHHMIDVCDPVQDFSVSRYCEMATPIVEEILAQGKTVILAGGTGLYMDSLIRGNDFAPYPATGRRQALEAQAEAEGVEILMERLRAVDPETAGRLHLSDRRRIIRALEIFEETGKTMTQHNLDTQTKPSRFSPLWLGLDFACRQTLYDRIDLRVDRMLAQGLLAEIEALLTAGVSPGATAMQAIGYKEFVAALQGEISLDQAVEDVKRGSRRYAKRQLTWFRRNGAMHWITRQEGEEGPEIFRRAMDKVLGFDKDNVV